MDRWLRLVMLVALGFSYPLRARSQEKTEQPASTSLAGSPGSREKQQPKKNIPNPEEPQQELENPPASPLSSAISRTSGASGVGVGYVLPSFEWTGYLRRGYSPDLSSPDQQALSAYVGSLVLQQLRRRSQLNLNYALGAQLYSESALRSSNVPPPSYGIYQSMGITRTQSFGKATLVLSDSFSYLPESSNGFTGFGGLNSFGGGSGSSALGSQVSINPALLPDQSILTGSARRYSNTAVAEVQYGIGPRSSITASGSYGLLNFVEPGFINSRSWTLLTGYNYALSARHELSISYLDNLILFGGARSGILVRGAQVGYRRRLTGRLSLQLAGGPTSIEMAQPQGGSFSQAAWMTNDELTYRSMASDLRLSFLQYTTPGSGVLQGAQTSYVSFSAGRRILRNYHGTLDFGHTYNQSLGQRLGSQNQARAESWETGAQLSHEFTHRTSIYARYQFQRQRSNRTLCIQGDCSTLFLIHYFGFGINWHGRPIHIH